MADKPLDMNDLLRGARGIEMPEPKTKRERKKQHDAMNALLRSSRGFTIEEITEEEITDA